MLLLCLVCIPFFLGVLCWQFERVDVRIPRWIALCGMALIFGISIFLWKMQCYKLDACFTEFFIFPDWRLEFIYPWIPRFGISLHLALDGFSSLMLMLSAFVGCISVLCSWNEINRYQGCFYFNLLWILGGIIGVFLSVDMFLFFIFWEIILIPMYLLISLWGNDILDAKIRIRAATKFLMYMQCSSLFMFISIITLAVLHYNVNNFWSFDYQDFLCMKLPKNVEYLLMLGFFLAFAVKLPIFPFHGWNPDVHSCTPTSGSVDLIGVLLKTAAYGLFRFSLPLFPYASQAFSCIAMCLGLCSIFYGAWMAFAQIDMKRLIAYSSISHMGYILIAVYSNSQLSYQGAVVQMIAHSLSASGMFVLCGQLYERLRTFDMRIMGGGLWNRLHLIPAFSLCFVAATFGLPGTGNFVGEIIILFGSFSAAPIITVIATFGILFSSIYTLFLMQRVYYGSTLEYEKLLKNMTLREKFIVIILLLFVFFIGFFPQFILDTSYITMKSIHCWLQQCTLNT